ncbi:hypothetical protein [Snodgrassella sp. M0351]|nr:hypothetical protein [Snodgrassella sp. M0351]
MIISTGSVAGRLNLAVRRERQDDGWLNQYTAKVFGNELRT